MADDVPLLAATDICKRYGGVQALRGASLSLHKNQIHGLIGENGSGKSTLLGVLSGQVMPDSGQIALNGYPNRLDAAALRSRVAIVTQELSLAPDLTVAENILMSRAKPRSWAGIDWKKLNARAASALRNLGLDIDPRTELGKLRIDQQQLVEIAKAVELGRDILILDEPTSSLTDDEVEALASTMRKLRNASTSIVFVSHRLDEFFALTDHVTVLRDGQTVASRPIAGYTRDEMVHDMLGYPVEPYRPSATAAAVRDSEPVLRVRELTVPGAVHKVSLELHPGEVVSLVGMEGAGRSELLEAVFGASPHAAGAVVIGGTAKMAKSPKAAMRRGLALVPADRKTGGLFLEQTIGENLHHAVRARRSRLRRVSLRKEASASKELSERLRVQRGPVTRAVGSLSGGNQQKVLLGKWMHTDPTVILLDEPTRGVDVGAKREIHQLITELRDRGVGIIVSSSDMDELMTVSDRFVVMFRGRIVGELSRAEATQARLSHLATGGAA